MSVHRLNDAPILDQVQEHWQKLMALVLWKFYRGETVKITHADMVAYQRDFDAGKAFLLTHGHYDSIDLAIIDAEAARALSEHQQTQTGHA